MESKKVAKEHETKRPEKPVTREEKTRAEKVRNLLLERRIMRHCTEVRVRMRESKKSQLFD